MFRQSVDEKPSEKWSKRPGVFALTMTIQLCVNSASELMLERIRNLRMLPLRAHLLVRFAEALGANGTTDDSEPSEKKEQNEKSPQPLPDGVHAPDGDRPR